MDEANPRFTAFTRQVSSAGMSRLCGHNNGLKTEERFQLLVESVSDGIVKLSAWSAMPDTCALPLSAHRIEPLVLTPRSPASLARP
jgi:hypothetical protein